MKCRILKQEECIITNEYSSNHQAIDIVGNNHQLDYIKAHSDGKIIFLQDGFSNMKGSVGNKSYGNCIKIEHQNGYYTLYAHLQNNLSAKNNQDIKKGQILGYMGDSGNAYGKHLHFEVWKDNQRINPTKYLNEDFEQSTISVDTKYKLGNTVTINGVYISSTSKEKLIPAMTTGTITKIIPNTNNPYLLNDGQIGWVNDNVIISIENIQYLSNQTYQGVSIVDALKEINVDSSYQYRSQLAKLNNINNYQGTSEQNTTLLNLLKQGKLKEK